jgi:type II secretory pathway pseudopilin PulG
LATFRCNDNEAGFSLAETLVATALLAASIAALGQLFALSVLNNHGARNTTFASVLAQQKMEQLRSLTYGFDTIGLPLTDTTSNIARFPPTPNGGTGVSPSPGDSLTRNSAGFVDFLDAYGQVLGNGDGVMPNGTVYIRRWSVEPLPTNPNNTVIFQVLVTRARDRGQADVGNVGRMPDEARLISVKTRKAA